MAFNSQTIVKIQPMDILDHNVEFVISSVKISFYTRESKVYPGGLFFMNHIVMANMELITVMKIER